MAKTIMIQGTMSNAGKSFLCAGLCRIFKQDGYRAAPFKSQNMALNSYITKDGLEMGRAQAVQAEAAGTEPAVEMNPVLLKPTNDVGSQVIVNGEVLGNMSAREYFTYKKRLIPDLLRAFEKLDAEYDVIVIEGAGSPAEINLKTEDIVNMGLAKLVDAPVLLVGDIDRGGVFAQLLGTVMLLEEEERERIKGVIINKFRGDKTILAPGISMLEEKIHMPVLGVTPYLPVEIEEEDSLSERFFGKRTNSRYGRIEIAVILMPRISNYTDFMLLENREEVFLHYVKRVSELGDPDLILLPGTKNTMGDLLWMRQNGLEAAVIKAARKGTAVFGICGGYQMLGEALCDPLGIENGGAMRGMGLLPVQTTYTEGKTRTRVHGRFAEIEGVLGRLLGRAFEGYEIHMGETVRMEENLTEAAKKCTSKETVLGAGMTEIIDAVSGKRGMDGLSKGNVYGTYVHGIFDREEVADGIISSLAEKKGIRLERQKGMNFREFKETQYDLLAAGLREHMDMKKIYRIMGFTDG